MPLPPEQANKLLDRFDNFSRRLERMSLRGHNFPDLGPMPGDFTQHDEVRQSLFLALTGGEDEIPGEDE